MTKYYNGPKVDPALSGDGDPVTVVATKATDPSLASKNERVRIVLGDGRQIEVDATTIGDTPTPD